MSLQGRVAVVTGASRGIGRATAIEFARQGATVTAVARNRELLDGLVKEIQAAGGKAEAAVADVTDGESVKKLIDDVVGRHGKIDILVNNAGITRDALFLTMEDADWNAVIEANLKSVFLVSRAAAKHMLRARYGRIINVSSVVGIHGNKGQSNYAASKAGIIGFTKSIAQELAGRNITANVIAPGFVTTDMTGVLPEEIKKAALTRIPLKRMGEPADIASAAAFLASQGAGYITGAVLPVDGGMAM